MTDIPDDCVAICKDYDEILNSGVNMKAYESLELGGAANTW
jgi:hypothetical protein